MKTLEQILDERTAKYGKTDPTLSPELNTIKRVAERKAEQDWLNAKKKLLSKTPLGWFEVVLDEYLQSGKKGTKNLSELKHWGFLREKEDIYEIDKMSPFEAQYNLTVQINKKQSAKSCLILYNRELGQMYRFPDWDSLRASAAQEKKLDQSSKLKIRGEKGAKND